MTASGARQESDESCGPLFRSAFPEVLKATTEFRAAKGDDGVGAVNGPVHPSRVGTRKIFQKNSAYKQAP